MAPDLSPATRAQLEELINERGNSLLFWQRSDLQVAIKSILRAIAEESSRVGLRQGAAQAREEGKQTTICLSGSSRFIDIMAVVAWELEKRGHVTLHCNLLPSWYTQTAHHLAEEQGVAAVLDDVHLRKIALADELMVIDVDGYIGSSTALEITHADRLGKRVLYLSNDQNLLDQLAAAFRVSAKEEGK